MKDFFTNIQAILQNNPTLGIFVEYFIGILLSGLVYVITNFYVVPVIVKYTKKTKAVWDDFLIKERILQSLALLVSLLILLRAFHLFSYKPAYIETIIICLIIAVFLLLFFRVINFLVGLYETLPFAKRVPIKNFGQLFKIICSVIAGILMVSVFSGKSPLLILSGIGAVSAVMLFVFKDTILSFIAGIQVAGLNIMSVGDYIEAPSYNADGAVIEISLYTVKIQNWDYSISLVPINKLLETNFKNWRGMKESGLRRIKRNLLIDMNTIRNLTLEELETFSSFSLLTEYIRDKSEEINTYNKNIEEEDTDPKSPNIRQLTNIGTYRAYMLNYLKNHPMISKEGTLMVRQLQPTQTGLPLEVYAFSNNTDWVIYENLQSDIFDHFMSICGRFDLKVFQDPTGEDFSKLKPSARKK